MKSPLVSLEMLKAGIDMFNHCKSRVLIEVLFGGSLTEKQKNKSVPL